MAYPHNVRSSEKTTIIRLSGNFSDGDVTVPLNVPPRSALVAAVLRNEGSGGTNVLTFAPYVNEAQTITGPDLFFAEPNDNAQVATVTVTAGTNGTLVHFVPAQSLFMGAGVYNLYGFEVTVNVTGATGTWHVEAICVEA